MARLLIDLYAQRPRMKIKSPFLLKTIGFTIACFVRSWISTINFHYHPLGKNFDPNQPDFQGRYIYMFWHENLLMPAYQYGRPDISVLISNHSDGEMIAQACKHLGFSLVRGSSTRGGIEAIRNMVKLSKAGHIAITPDGPKGPRGVVQPGIVYLASKSGLPIIPMGFAYSSVKRANSWDKFAIPNPFSKVVLVTTPEIYIPQDLDKENLQTHLNRVQSELDRASEVAHSILQDKMKKAA